MAAPRTRTGCASCRVRHLKWFSARLSHCLADKLNLQGDETRPVCRRCQRAGRECIRGYNVRFRYGTSLTDAGEQHPRKGAEYQFEEDQTWLGTSGEVSFVDETADLERTYHYTTTNSRSVSPESSASPQLLQPRVINTTSPNTLSSSSPQNSVSISNLISSSSSHNTTSPGDVSTTYDATVDLSPSALRDAVIHNANADITQLPLSSINSTANIPRNGELNKDSGATRAYTRTAAAVPDGEVAAVAESRGGIPLEVILHTRSSSIGPSLPVPTTQFSSTADTPSSLETNDNDISAESDIPSLYLSRPLWPFPDPKVAELMRHYIENLGAWFDMNDAQCHFKTVVPRVSSRCPMLTNAILAFSARHLSSKNPAAVDPYVATHYLHECLKAYIPYLSSAAAAGDNLDPAILTATVILRTYEELDVAHTSSDQEHHLLGSSIFVALQPSLAISGGLPQACFWVYLRQDIYISFINQRPIRTNLSNLILDRSFSATDDCTWANRIVFKTAEVLEFAFGGVSSSHAPTIPSLRAAQWNQLWESVDTWDRCRPEGFEALYYRARDPGTGRWWPEVWYTMDCHATGMQYLYLCRILLAIYNPTLPRMGPKVKAATKHMEGIVVDSVRAICGIASSCRSVPAPLWFTACHAIYVCGEWFGDPGEREAMMELLRMTEEKWAWPTKMARSTMREQWGVDGGEEERRVSVTESAASSDGTGGHSRRISIGSDLTGEMRY